MHWVCCPTVAATCSGIWIEQTEGAKFWLKVFNELKSRGVDDILIAVVDGLKGLAEAIETVFPRTTVQTCIVHLIRNSLEYASWKDRRAVAAAIRPIYTSGKRRGSRARARSVCRQRMGREIPDHRAIVEARLVARHSVLCLSPEVRKVIYTTNVIESLHMQLAQDHQDPRPLPLR